MNADLELVTRYAETHDAEAFSALVGKYQHFVYSVCLRILGDMAGAEDATQECFLSMARQADKIHTSPAGWLHRRATHVSINIAKQQQARTRREKIYSENKAASQHDTTWQEIAPAIDEALDELPDDLRHILIEHFLRRRTQVDIAKELNTSPATMSRRINTGVEKLRKKLKKAGIVAASGLLLTLLGENMAQAAAPAALTAALGKIAMAGLGKTAAATAATGSSAAATATATASVIGLKVQLVALTAAVAIAGGSVAYVAVRNPSEPQPPPVANAGKGETMQAASELTRAFMILLGIMLAPENQQTIHIDFVVAENGVELEAVFIARKSQKGYDISLWKGGDDYEPVYSVVRKEIPTTFTVVEVNTEKVKNLDLKAIMDQIQDFERHPTQVLSIGDTELRITKAGNNIFIKGHREREMFIIQLGKEEIGRMSYGPVKELMVESRMNCIDFDTGEILSKPEGLHGNDEIQWARNNGIDARCNPKGFFGASIEFSDTTMIWVDEKAWNAPPVAIPDRIQPGVYSILLGAEDGSEEKKEYGTSTCLFKTREGTQGIVQIIGTVTSGRSYLSIRYKLVEKKEPVVRQQTSFNPVTERAVFGPTKELSVIVDHDKGSPGVDLDTGTLFDQPDIVRTVGGEHSTAWLLENGIDACFETGISICGLSCFDVVVAAVDSEAWDDPPISVLKSLDRATPAPMAIMSSRVQVPATFLFRTREGGTGVLQILAVDDHSEPKTVRIRYKLIEKKTPATAKQDSMGPVIGLGVNDDSVDKSVIPPYVIKTEPANRAVDVDFELGEIKVTFDRPMLAERSWSWVTLNTIGPFPGIEGSGPRWENDGKTCVLEVNLMPDTLYAVGINSPRYTNFRDPEGKAAVPYAWVFKTKQLTDSRSKCMHQLRYIASQCHRALSVQGDGQSYPGSLAALIRENRIPEQKRDVFICPADNDPQELDGLLTSYDSIFDLTKKRIECKDELKRITPMIWENAPRHDGMRCVAFFDTHVEVTNEKHFATLMERLKQFLEHPTTDKSSENPEMAPKEPLSPKRDRIGIYDSRSIAVAYHGSALFKAKMGKLMEVYQMAKKNGDTELMKKCEQQGRDSQKKAHSQGFGTAPVDDILANVEDEMTALMQKHGLTQLVSKWNDAALATHKNAEHIDVTRQMIDVFDPNEKSLKYAIEIQEKEPISDTDIRKAEESESH